MTRHRVSGLLMVAALSTVGTASAQVPAAPRELGMGGAYVGVSRGYESVFLAPGNLALPDAPRWSFGFPQGAIGLTLLGVEFEDIPDLIEFNDLDAARQDELVALIPLEGAQGAFSFRAPIAALSVGSVGLGVQVASAGRHTVSRDLAELFIKGYEDGRTDYSVDDTFGERATYWDFAGAYARRVGSFYVGATGHYFRGQTIVRTRLFEPRIDLEAQDVEVDYLGVRAKGGSGYGLDVGAAYNPAPEFTVSVNVSNAFARMNWSKDLYLRQLTLDRDLIENGTPRDINNRYAHSEVPFDPTAASLRAYETAQGLYDEAYFPAVLRVGGAWKPLESTMVGIDVHTKLTDGRLVDDWNQRVALGVQQELLIFKVRAGYASGSDGGNLIGGGLSIGPLDLGVARYVRSDIDGDSNNGWIASFGLGVAQEF